MNNFTLDALQSIGPIEFENLVTTLLIKMGFDAATTKASGDGGIDIIATNEQPIVGGKYVVQCKRYATGNNIGEPIVRELFGVMMHENANKGILIATSEFTRQAVSFAQNKAIELINGNTLMQLLNQYLADMDNVFANSSSDETRNVKYLQQFEREIAFILGREEKKAEYNKTHFSDSAEYYYHIQENPSEYCVKEYGIKTPTVGKKLRDISNFYVDIIRNVPISIDNKAVWETAIQDNNVKIMCSFLKEYITKTLEVYREFLELTPPNNENAIDYYDSCVAEVKKIFVILKATDEMMKYYNPLLIKLVLDNLM